MHCCDCCKMDCRIRSICKQVCKGGSVGPPGPPGADGNPGADGIDGKSAYEIAVEGGYIGTEDEWIASLKGQKGDTGDKGPRGEQGLQGVDGPQGIQGENGLDGTSLHVLGSYETYDDFIAEHPTGNPGDAWFADGYLYVWNESSQQWDNVGYLRGPQGIQGIQGIQGLQGEPGEPGIKGDKGDQGDRGPTGPAGTSPTLNYISAIYNQQRTYVAGDLLQFYIPASFARNGISLASNTFTLTSKTVYEICLNLEVLTVVSGQPRIELLVNGTLISPPQLNARANGWHAYDIILTVPANATIQFRVANGSFTTAADFSGIVHCVTIKSLN